MNSKQKIRLVEGIVAIVLGVLTACIYFIGSHVLNYIGGIALCIAGVVLIIVTSVNNKQVMSLKSIVGGVLVAFGIGLLIPNFIADFAKLANQLLLLGCAGVGAVLLIDTIVNFFRKRKVALNIFELIIALGLIAAGVVFLIIDPTGTIIYLIAGIIIGLFGIILLISSFINPEKYKEIIAENAKNKK